MMNNYSWGQNKDKGIMLSSVVDFPRQEILTFGSSRNCRRITRLREGHFRLAGKFSLRLRRVKLRFDLWTDRAKANLFWAFYSWTKVWKVFKFFILFEIVKFLLFLCLNGTGPWNAVLFRDQPTIVQCENNSIWMWFRFPAGLTGLNWTLENAGKTLNLSELSKAGDPKEWRLFCTHYVVNHW